MNEKVKERKIKNERKQNDWRNKKERVIERRKD
jgi:hypothetical protein